MTTIVLVKIQVCELSELETLLNCFLWIYGENEVWNFIYFCANAQIALSFDVRLIYCNFVMKVLVITL